MRLALCSPIVCWVLFASGVDAQTLFYDAFEHGVSHDTSGGAWSKYPNATEYLQGDSSHNHTPGGSQSARAWEADPYVYNSYADFGATDHGLKATVYLFEDMSYVPPYLDQPVWKQPYIEVRSMFSLFGDSPGGPGDLSDYLQIRLIPDVDRPQNPAPDHYSYGIETKYNDDHGLGIIDTGVLREKSQWMKLEIDADSVAAGGQVRFYINDALVGSSYRSGPDLRWVMLGATKITYENYWYDDVSVVSANGDFNGDGRVDNADYVLWRKTTGGTNIDGYNIWRQNFGLASGMGAANSPQSLATVPEPSSLPVVVALCCAGLLFRRNYL